MINRKMKHIILILLFFFSVMPTIGIADDQINFNEENVEPTVRSQTSFTLGAFEANATALSYSIEATPITTQFPYVLLSATVFDSEKQPLTGLTAEDFLVQERVGENSDFSPVPIVCFSSSTTASGLSFALVADISSSMKDKLADIKTVAAHFINNANPNDKAALISFSTGGTEKTVKSLNWIHSDANMNGTPDITDALNNLSVDTTGETAIFDATAEGMNSLADAVSSKIVILFSDGSTNSDKQYDINTVVERAREENITIYTVCIGGIGVDFDNLKNLASATGGKYYFALTSEDIRNIYTKIYNDFPEFVLKRYNIWYQADSSYIDGSKHEFTVTCKGASTSGSYTALRDIEITVDDASKNLKLGTDSTRKEFTLSGSITDVCAAALNQAPSAALFYRWDSSDEYSQLSLSLTEDTEQEGNYSFKTTFPVTMDKGKGFQYFIKAFDDVRENFSPFNYTVLPHYIPDAGNTDIEIIHTPVTHVDADQPVNINASITQSDDTVDLVLYYRCHEANREGTFLRSAMSTTDSLNFNASIPAGYIPLTGIDYFIVAISQNLPISFIGTASEPNFISVGDTYFHPPVADAGLDKKAVEGDIVILDGTASVDEDPEDILTYAWQQIAGTIVILSDDSMAKPSFIAPAHGENGSVLTFSLTVGDTNCQYSTDIVNITITDDGPVAQFTYAQDNPFPGEPVYFTDESVSSVDGIISWVWDFGGEGTSYEQNPSFSFDEPGTYIVTVTVTDSDGSTSTSSEVITIFDPATYSLMSADAGSDQTVTEEDLVQLDGTNSTGTNTGGTLAYQWEQLEGTTVELFNPDSATPTFIAPLVDEDGEVLTFLLTVTDDTGLESQATVRVTVNDSVCQDCEENAGCFISVSSKSADSKIGSRLSGIFFLLVCSIAFLCLNKGYGIRSKLISCLVIIPFLCPLNGYAEIFPNTLSISGLVGRYVFDKDQDIDHDFTGGIGIGYDFDEHWGTELIFHYGQFTYNYFDVTGNRCAEDDLDKYSVYLNALYHLWPDSRLNPFLTAGVGYINLDFDNFETYSSGLINYGGGLKYWLTDRIALRADVRHVFCFDESYNNLSCLLGVMFRFGSTGKDVTPPPVIVEEEKEIPAEIVAPVTPPVVAVAVKPALPVALPLQASLLFGLDKAQVRDIYNEDIIGVGKNLKNNDDLIAIVEGHTCDLGAASYNMQLSKKRAEAVKAAIVKTSDVPPERIFTEAMGESSPIVPNDSPQNREKNRRVVIKYKLAEESAESTTVE